MLFVKCCFVVLLFALVLVMCVLCSCCAIGFGLCRGCCLAVKSLGSTAACVGLPCELSCVLCLSVLCSCAACLGVCCVGCVIALCRLLVYVPMVVGGAVALCLALLVALCVSRCASRLLSVRGVRVWGASGGGVC